MNYTIITKIFVRTLPTKNFELGKSRISLQPIYCQHPVNFDSLFQITINIILILNDNLIIYNKV